MTRRYVHEFDALRALAVLGVLLFHGFPELVPAGFLGVDIFFVISGHVISRVYLQALLTRETAWGTFFFRRFRRLAPAYVLVLVASVPPAVALLEPHLLRDYGLSLLAQPFYLQNVAFWWQGDYFTSPLSKPLLHTWSLAVEEQFYVLFFVLVCLSRRFRSRLLFPALLIGGALASFCLSVLLIDISPKTAFYLVPFRAWQFMLGIATWLLVSHFTIKTPRAGHAVVTWSLLAALASVVLLVQVQGHSTTGYTLLVCVLTAALLISFELREHASYRLLHARPVMILGQASYAIYLWHWPVIVYATMMLGAPLKPLQAVLAITLSLVLGLLTWRHVEKPVRQGSRSWPPLRNALLASSALFLITGGVLLQSGGALFLYDEPARTWLTVAQDKSPYRCPLSARLRDLDAELCAINAVDSGEGLLIIGDSVADQVDEMIASIATELRSPAFLTTRNCDLNEFGAIDFCSKTVFERLLDDIDRLDIRHVLAISNWHEDIDAAQFELALAALVKRKITVTLVQALPSGEYFNPRTRAERYLQGRPEVHEVSPREHARRNASRHAVLAQLHERYEPAVRLLDPGRAICRSDPCDQTDGGKPLYFDNVHLSSFGAQRLRPVYLRELTHLSRHALLFEP